MKMKMEADMYANVDLMEPGEPLTMPDIRDVRSVLGKTLASKLVNTGM